MKKVLLTAAMAALFTMITAVSFGWATGMIDPITLITRGDFSSLRGEFHVDGTISVDGTDLEMPFSLTLSMNGEDEPQLREFKLGDRVSLQIPAVLRAMVGSNTGIDDGVRYIGAMAKLGLTDVRLGFHIDALRVEFVINSDLEGTNPYREVTTYDIESAQQEVTP